MALSAHVPDAPRPSLEVEELMEPALRIQVLLAQCQAGMWRRNGYSLQNQVSLPYCLPACLAFFLHLYTQFVLKRQFNDVELLLPAGECEW